MAFTHTIRARYAEVDMQGVVFNAHWLTYFDDASTRFFGHLGFNPSETFTAAGEFDVMVVHAVLDWSGSAGLDDVVVIDVTTGRIGTKSFDLRYSASVDGTPVCEGTVTYVSVRPGTHESCEIPGALREQLERHMSA